MSEREAIAFVESKRRARMLRRVSLILRVVGLSPGDSLRRIVKAVELQKSVWRGAKTSTRGRVRSAEQRLRDRF